METKKFRELERIFKGIASERRVHILVLLDKEPEQTLGEIAERIKLDYRTTSEHIRKMAIAGIIMKRHEGPSVCHTLTDRGKAILYFCRNTV